MSSIPTNKSLLSKALNERPYSVPIADNDAQSGHKRTPSIPNRPATSTPLSQSTTPTTITRVAPIQIPSPQSPINRPSSHQTSHFNAVRGSASPSLTFDLPSFDRTSTLSKASVVKSRTGSVLTRGFILKTDFYPNGKELDLDINLGGAPNFRSPRTISFNVFGVAQPRIAGIRAILSLLGCHPRRPQNSKNAPETFDMKERTKGKEFRKCLWFNTREEPVVYIGTRPFVLRDVIDPKQNLQVADSAEILEAVEQRLKEDILNEAAKFGGLVLTHNEQEDSGGIILPTWTAADSQTVKTSREVWESMKVEGWPVEYHRIPITTTRPIEDNYLDAYLEVLKSASPTTTPIVFSCGMGAVRTTYAMVAACIVRRKQCIELGLGDPFIKEWRGFGAGTPAMGVQLGSSPGSQSHAAIVLEQAEIQREHNESLLRLAHILQQNLDIRSSSASAIQILVSQPSLQANLQNALRGNYSIVLSLLGIIDNGPNIKKLVDRIINSVDHVVNLREEILTGRIRYSVSRGENERRQEWLDKSAKALEKYYFIIAFASYVESCHGFEETFADWLKARVEITNQVMFLRRSGSSLKVFAPISDLKSLSQAGLETRDREEPRKRSSTEVTIAGGQILGDEWAEHVVRNRGGIILRASMLLKSDQWHQESEYTPNGIRGASSFRNIPNTNIYACGQPTADGIDEVVGRVQHDFPETGDIIWITLREEPIILINGAPYCLRRESYSLRNMKDYGGISASRLEILEERLRDDVLAELRTYGGRILLHTEASDGQVIPLWEEARETDVAVLKDVFASKRMINGARIHYSRVPITSERPPDFHDISDLMEVVIRTHTARTPIIINCQLGKRRSTVTAIVIKLIQDWIQGNGMHTRTPKTPGLGPDKLKLSNSITSMSIEQIVTPISNQQPSYQVINNLLRVIRNGLEVKRAVDDAISQCSQTFNVHKAIETARIAADEAVDERQKWKESMKGLHHLRQYFELIIFQAYLAGTPPDTWRDLQTFEDFVKERPVFRTFEKELTGDGADALKPLERVEVSDGVAMPDEVGVTEYVCGSGMPTAEGLRRALKRLDASPEGKNSVFWTSLREEPVLYVNGRPHVLRRIDRPLQNMEATGVTTDVVERMEKSLKRDVQKEVITSNGRILLHDEVEDAPGKFTITPQWETISVDDIMTPRDVFEQVVKEGYKVDYARVAITDEQAPLPESMATILERVKLGLGKAGDLVFNCQMGRGRTTTGMVCASLVATVLYGDYRLEANSQTVGTESDELEPPSMTDGVSEETAYLNGEYKIILQLVGLLSHGKLAKRLADASIDRMEDVQNLRKAVFDYKLKVAATDKARLPGKYNTLLGVGITYLYRYATLIVFANYLVEMRIRLDVEAAAVRVGGGGQLEVAPTSNSVEKPPAIGNAKALPTFPAWLEQRREVRTLLGKRSLD
ncbi:hypothetical protein FRC20_009226 [Serendipita sp. 405]|nr:hypothetical protein FRC20_009226 [Serendipita sp. 405]